MLRFLSFLFNKPYEPCKSCETLKEQLSFERDEKKRLTDTLLNIIQPKAVEQPVIELAPIAQTSALFSRRRAAEEEKDRITARILNEKKHLGIADKDRQNEVLASVSELEHQLGIETLG